MDDAKGVRLADAAAPAGMVLYAIGDVHGRLDLLSEMHDQIARDREARKAADWRIIHLGDYVDRGPDSKGVLEFIAAAMDRDRRVLALAGNHDVGFREFLVPGEFPGIFLKHGGPETARSYGVELDLSSRDTLLAGQRALIDAVPARHAAFLRDLGFSAEFGDFFFCHAGIRPGVPLDAQDKEDLVWIRQDFLDHAGLHPKVIVHGHTPVPAAQMRNNRVNLDTGAVMTGILTALVVDGAEKRLLRVGSDSLKRDVDSVGNAWM